MSSKYRVGLRTLPFTDTARRNWQQTGPRPLVTDIWYPADENASETEILIGPPNAPLFLAGRAARDAALAPAPQQFPLILLSHGTGGTAMQLAWLAPILAAQGYIVAGVNHHGNTALESYTLQGFTHVWERARDLSEVITQLLAHPDFGPRINPHQVGAAGFSLGGYTMIALAGGRADLQEFHNAYTRSGRKFIDDVPPEFRDPAAFAAYFDQLAATNTEYQQSFRDERIKAVFAIAPVLGEAFTPQALASISIPVCIVVGASDAQAVPERNAEHFARHIPRAQLTILPAPIGHYVFLDECTDFGKQELPMLCVDPPHIDRRAVHAQVSEMARLFFEATL